MEFKPQKVEPISAWIWFREGLDISIRQPLAFVVITILFTSLHYLPELLSIFFVFSMPVLLGVVCIIAESSDHNQSPINDIMKKSALTWAKLFMVGCFPWLSLIVVSLLLSLLVGPGQPTEFVPLGTNEVFKGGLHC